MNKFVARYISVLVLCTCTSVCHAQNQFGDDPPPLVTGFVGAEASITSNKTLPFWMRANKSGSVPSPGAAGSLLASIRKAYDPEKYRKFQIGGGLTVRANAGSSSQLMLIEGYVKMKANVFQFKAGRSADVMGLVGDSSLSSGSFATSGNAPGIPKVELSIPEYEYIFGDKLFAFKGTFGYGWVGKGAQNNGIYYYDGPIYMHEKSLYGRFGKETWGLKLIGGFNHQAMWGWDRNNYGDRYDLSPLQAFKHIIIGKVYKGSKLGNQVGSIDLGFEYDFRTVKLIAYRQSLYDVGALYHLANLRDGLHGITLINKVEDRYSTIIWKKLLFEILYTKNQAGEIWSKLTPSGDENYYNNFGKGWSYKDAAIGTPFITPAHTTRDGFPNEPADYFNNNRVAVFHLGVDGQVYDWDFRTKLSYSINWGTYGTSEYGHSLGPVRTPPTYGLFKKVNQFSGFFSTTGKLNEKVSVGAELAIDLGGLYYNNIGVLMSIRHQL